jgi:hypothetical protein
LPHETPKGRPDDDDDDGDDTFVEKYGKEHSGKIAGSYLKPYVYGRKSLDTQYGIRKDSDGKFDWRIRSIGG